MRSRSARCLLYFLYLCGSLVLTVSATQTVHLKISRRNGRFVRRENANLTRLTRILRKTEERYMKTYRVADENRLVRKWQDTSDIDGVDGHFFNSAGHGGSWFAAIPVGEPPQLLEFDLDMLAPEFYTIMTTSDKGSKYDIFASKNHVPNGERVHPYCQRPSDTFDLGNALKDLRLELATCSPPKASRYTLFSSGSIIGLNPLGHLSRITLPSLINQLVDTKTIEQELWSITLFDAENGLLSLGGTIAREVEHAKIQAEIELQHYGDPSATAKWVQNEVKSRLALVMPIDSAPDQHFKWTNIQGSTGWWTALIAGVWINGAKVLKNQPVLFDIQCPFILAPPLAITRFYESIGAAKRLPSPHDHFFAFPCLNRVNIAFEFGGWNFPVMSGEGLRIESLYGPAGGKFSLGKLENGTGYCVGNIVETRMGTKDEWINSGMSNMWVLGEPFFRGIGVAFDVEQNRVGMRSY